MAQIAAAGLEPIIVRIPYPCPNEVYEREMAKAMEGAKARGITHIIFGDLYLEDIRAYREEKLKGTGITPVFPIWLQPTAELAREMIAAGVEAHLAVVDLKKLPASFAGRRFEAGLARRSAGRHRPVRRERRIPFVRVGRADAVAQDSGRVGETVERDGFAFADLLAES